MKNISQTMETGIDNRYTGLSRVDIYKVGVTMESTTIERPLASRNSDFHEKLTVAKQNEKLYREGQLSFNKVLKVYDGVGLIGSHYWEYWQARANFFAESGFLEAESGQRRNAAKDKGQYKVLASRKAFLETYVLWMNQAMSCKGADVDALEKEKKLNELMEKLENLTEFSPDSYRGLVDRPPTRWESLSGYLIGLCLIAAVILVVVNALE